MRKFLHLSLVCLMAMFCGTTFAQTVFDFDNDYQTLFPTLAGVSSNESHDGDFTEATTSTPQNGITVTVSAKASGSNENRIWTSTPRLRMYSGTLTVTAPQGRNITSIEFRTNDKWNVTPNVGTLNDREWTGSAQSVEFTVGGNSQINSLTVLLEGETIETVKYIKATTVESGKQYLIVADVDGALKIAQPVSSNYGYLDVEDANVVDDAIEIEENSTLPFTITSADGGYTIMQSDGRYLYQSGDYNNFNVDAEPSSGHIWTISPEADGTFTITNTSVNKFVQFDSQYNSFGSYADERGILPCLYVKDETGAGINNVTVDEEFDENAPVYNLAGQRVSKDAKGIVIQNGKKFIRK